MANEEHLALLKQSVDEWNKWRETNRIVLPDLAGANLSGADLCYADLGAADLRGADLAAANLSGAILYYATLGGADVREMDFSGGFSGYTLFVDIDLSLVKGLSSVVHKSPSSIGIDTIVKSRGEIPEQFLRGCGLSDIDLAFAELHRCELSNEEISNITYRIYHLRATQAVQINPLFISYNHNDGPFVDFVEKHLDEKGLRFWRDVHHATAGRLEKQIDRAMRLNPTVLLVLSEHSVESDWVEHEAATARELEKELKRDVLCPVALDDSWRTCSWPKVLRRQIMDYNILDFSKWQDDDFFARQFNKLIEGLHIFYAAPKPG